MNILPQHIVQMDGQGQQNSYTKSVLVVVLV